MIRIIAVLLTALTLASCSAIGEKTGEVMPQWMGGLPKDAPPRPGTPEFDEFQRKQEAERVRDKSKDPPKPAAKPPMIRQ